MSRWHSLSESWLDEISGQVDPETIGLYRIHLSTHMGPHFGSIDAVTAAAIASYGRKRLKSVKRETLKKERSTLRTFLSWCHEQGHLGSLPEFPPLAKKAAGTPYAVRRRGAATPLSPEECRALIAALPQWSRPRKGQAEFPIRARFALMFETALRPATLSALQVPTHYQRGSAVLVITDAIDKARFGREVPLNPRAREALDSALPKQGLIFGEHDYRYHLEAAAKKTLAPEKARTFAAYDLRHARLTELAEGGNLPGVAYLAGHKRISTTSIYVRPGLRAAQKALANASVSPASRDRKLAGLANQYDIIPVMAGRAKERTRTSTGVTPLAPQASGPNRTTPVSDLHTLAVSLLRATSDGSPVTLWDLYQFARVALESTELGRLALAVLDGGAFAQARAMELVRLVLASAETVGSDALGVDP